MDDDPTRRTVDEHLQRAELMYDLDSLPDAKEEVEAALRVDPFHADANALAGVLALAQHDPDEALLYAGAALAHDPAHHRALIVRGYALADADRRDEALQAAASLLELDRSSWILHVHYALITRRAGAAQPALDAAWNAVHLAPDQPRTHLALAAVAESLDMGDLAKRSRQAAVDLEPEAATSAAVQAKALPPEARRVARNTVDADPANPRWREDLYGPGLFRGALGRSILLGIAVVFGLPGLLGNAMPPVARLVFLLIAITAGVAWFTVLRRHRRAE
jgi:tetratricopeptide (TPR) repeat protein